MAKKSKEKSPAGDKREDKSRRTANADDSAAIDGGGEDRSKRKANTIEKDSAPSAVNGLTDCVNNPDVEIEGGKITAHSQDSNSAQPADPMVKASVRQGRTDMSVAPGGVGKNTRQPAIAADPQVRKFKLNQIHPAKYNPRVISPEAMEGLEFSLRRFGCVEPIIVNIRDGRNIIVGGNQRYQVLLNSGVKECLCVTVDLDETEEKTLNLTLNNPDIQGQFIERIDAYIQQLAEELGDENLMLELRLNELAGHLEPAEKTGNIPDDEIPRPPEKTRSKKGDLWLLGENRLLCGSSTNPDDVARLLDGQKAHLMATDPPYCVNYTGNDRPNGGHDWSAVYREKEIADFRGFLRSFLEIGFAHLQDHVALYLWHAHSHFGEIQEVCRELGILVHQQIIWVKPCAVMGYSYYSWRHENCLLMWRQGRKPPFKPSKKSLGSVWAVGFDKDGDPTTPEYFTDVWELDWEGKKRPGAFRHPTIKPVEVFAIPMRMHTQPGEICFEPFCGSGSQIIAAEKLQRRCYAMELEPAFCDVIVQRWEQWTGRRARRA